MSKERLVHEDDYSNCLSRDPSNNESAVLPRGVFGYYGSKQRLAKSILKHMPPHHCWVELFGGALALTMAKEPAKIEIVNDLDENIVNVFRQMRVNGNELVKLIELTPYARTELSRAREICDDDNDLERARKFLVQAMMSVNGVVGGNIGGFSTSDTFTRENREARVNRWYNYPERLKAVISRLRYTRIENKDGIELLVKFSNRPASLVYIDPPYLANRVAGYNLDATDQDFHERLLSQALLCKCMIMISGYKSKTYTELLDRKGGWYRIELSAVTQSTNGDRLGREELLWMNKHAEKALKTGRIGIRLKREEKRTLKVNPPRGQVRKCRRILRVT